MDLIYMNPQRQDVGVLQNYKLDLAYGCDENDFELAVSMKNHVCATGFFLYIEGTEYGGIIRKIRVKTEEEEIIYGGDTWHGILGKKILEPDADKDYLVCSGEAHAIIARLLQRCGLSDLFRASAEYSGLIIKSYKMNRYISLYDGIRKMLDTADAKLKITFLGGMAVLSAEKKVDYSRNDEFDSSQIDFDMEKHYQPVNHVICLGRGELAEREILHLYADAQGNISGTQTQFGLAEIAATYDYSSCESVEELEKGGRELLKELWNQDTLDVSFDADRNYDVGDIVGARENVTGIFVAREITKKIVTIQNGVVTITHKVGGS